MCRAGNVLSLEQATPAGGSDARITKLPPRLDRKHGAPSRTKASVAPRAGASGKGQRERRLSGGDALRTVRSGFASRGLPVRSRSAPFSAVTERMGVMGSELLVLRLGCYGLCYGLAASATRRTRYSRVAQGQLLVLKYSSSRLRMATIFSCVVAPGTPSRAS
jgi:hypothetical protein